jgi:hypothetical protein
MPNSLKEILTEELGYSEQEAQAILDRAPTYLGQTAKQQTIGGRIAHLVFQGNEVSGESCATVLICPLSGNRDQGYVLRLVRHISFDSLIKARQYIAQAIDAGIKEALEEDRNKRPVDNNLELIENLKARITELQNKVAHDYKINVRLIDEKTEVRQNLEQWKGRAEAFEKDCIRLKGERDRLKEQLASEREENDILVNRTPLLKDIVEKLDKHGHVTIRYK